MSREVGVEVALLSPADGAELDAEIAEEEGRFEEDELPPLPPAAEAAPASKLSNCVFVTHVEPPESSSRQISFVCTRLAKKSPIPIAASASHYLDILIEFY